MKNILLVSFALLFITYGCAKEGNQAVGASERYPVRIIFDTDMGSDCDDVGALALLHTYADQGKAEILGCVYSSGKVPYGAAIVQAINIYRCRQDLPVGAYQREDVGDPVDKMTAEKLAKDTAAFKNTIIHNRDAEDQTQLTRRILAAQPDSSVTYLTVGHTKGLYDLLQSKPDEISPLSGQQLVALKVSCWVALGALGAKNPEGHFVKDWNFYFNNTAPYTRYVVEYFPNPIYLIDAGHQVMTGRSLKDTPPGNIVRTSYRDWLWNVSGKTLHEQRPSWDLAAVYFAVEGMGEFLEHPENGRLEFNQENMYRWVSTAEKIEQFYVQQKEGVNEAFADFLNEMIIDDGRPVMEER